MEKKSLLLTANNIALEKSQIENELEIKNKELAAGVIYQIQRNELVNMVIEKLKIRSSTENKTHHDLIKEILTELSKIQHQNAWEEFELRFQHVNNGFYKKLSEINPAFSVNDRRLCAFLKLDLTTKEISAITGHPNRIMNIVCHLGDLTNPCLKIGIRS